MYFVTDITKLYTYYTKTIKMSMVITDKALMSTNTKNGYSEQKKHNFVYNFIKLFYY
jgi:hypothetical protein